MADISKETLKKEIQEILKDADLDNTSAKKVRLQLEEKLDCDLQDRKKEVDELVMEVIDEQTQDDEAEEDEEEEEESESEEDTPPKKKKPVVAKNNKSKKRADSDESGSEYSPPGSDDEEEVPSDGGGSDYEPDEPVRIGRGAKSKKKVSRRDSDEESSGEEWGGRKKGGKKGRKRAGSSDDDDDSDYEKPKAKKKSSGGGGGKGNGYTAPVKLSAELADIVGGDEMPRHEVVKRMWAYIKENNLQDPKNKAFVKCDEKLQKIIPNKKFRGFGMTKFLKDHMNVDADE